MNTLHSFKQWTLRLKILIVIIPCAISYYLIINTDKSYTILRVLPTTQLITLHNFSIITIITTAAETRKLLTNGSKCEELGWKCIPLAVETFCNWGKEAHLTFSRLAPHLAISLSSPKSSILVDMYCRMNLTLVRSIARAILAREFLPS